jgi:hypothetical protein
VEIRLADVRVADSLEPRHRLGRPRGHVVGEQDRPVGRDQAGGVEEVLDRERNPLADAFRPGEEDPLGQKTAR